MIPGTPDQARWMRTQPRRDLPRATVERIVQKVFPASRFIDAQPLAGGFRNTNLKLRLDAPPACIVLRVYEHDPALCRKEMDLLRLVRGSVPVAEILHVEPDGWDDLPPFALMRHVAGAGFGELEHSGDREAIAQAAYSAGEILAAIGRITFPKSGWLGPGPAVGAPLLDGADPMPRFVELCLDSPHLQRRMPVDLRKRVHALVWQAARQLAALNDQTRLVHGDFNGPNLLVRRAAGRWSVAAVLDWEFAVSGSPLGDIGNFLRFERAQSALLEPHFSSGYCGAGGVLPQNWRQLSQLVDLLAVCEILSREWLAEAVSAALVEVARATAETAALSG